MRVYCKNCRRLFEDFIKCPGCRSSYLCEPDDCDIVLLAKLGMAQADELESILDGMGIPCFLKGGISNGPFMCLGYTFDRVQVYVSFRVYDKALKVLDDFMNHRIGNETKEGE